MKLSRMAFGAMRLLEGRQDLEKRIQTCLDVGITTMDHADIYGNYSCEEEFGRVLKSRPSLRSRMQIVTKCGICLISDERPEHRLKHYDYSVDHIVNSVERSLKNLGCENIDLLLFHRPSPLLDPDEVAEAVEQLKTSGKVVHFGVSNFSVSQVRMLESRVDLAAQQIEVSPLHLNGFNDGTLDQCIEMNMIPMAWSPLAGGRLMRTPDQGQGLASKLGDLSRKYGCDVDQLIYAWLLRHPSNMTVVTGTQDIERLKKAAAAERIEVELQDWFDVWTSATGSEVP